MHFLNAHLSFITKDDVIPAIASLLLSIQIMLISNCVTSSNQILFA